MTEAELLEHADSFRFPDDVRIVRGAAMFGGGWFITRGADEIFCKDRQWRLYHLVIDAAIVFPTALEAVSFLYADG
jgi:hypothetical protein